MDVENIDALNPAELDALLERALDPQVPVEVFYAVLERIGPHEPSAESTPLTQSANAASPQPLPGTLLPLQNSSSSPGSPTQMHASGQAAQAAHPQASQGTSAVYQMSGTQCAGPPAQQTPAARRLAQHGPPPRGFAIPVSGTDVTTVMRPIADADAAHSGSAAIVPPPDDVVSPTAQTTMMAAVPASEADDRAEKPSR